jgi:hypothetical protein
MICSSLKANEECDGKGALAHKGVRTADAAPTTCCMAINPLSITCNYLKRDKLQMQYSWSQGTYEQAKLQAKKAVQACLFEFLQYRPDSSAHVMRELQAQKQTMGALAHPIFSQGTGTSNAPAQQHLESSSVLHI